MRHKRAAGPLQRVVNDDLVWNMAVMVSLTPCRLGGGEKDAGNQEWGLHSCSGPLGVGMVEGECGVVL